MRALLIHSLKLIDEAGGIEERKIWRIAKSEKNPDGVRYRLAYIPRGQKRPAVLYDNHHPKGHHKHIGERQVAYAFDGVGKLLKDFESDIEALR
ncbi:MAG: hypothetical protein CO113_10515 [Elusimicrobia bacterium CG_4_9_14_3_um_filter_62_55]|nr:MAG: hypothetical protein COR54_20085 [Elusimicrobia bacterium CG22_combo_CG10-13_8_21_14_all_63_91]PJA17059.1 MAG: hypothetical protein COX66_06025 [Elusimicrobia bacterium CG_4_10_14_0_2_um_filter_63_34]PJB25090.1 MAG: hypothetical protein CO113_10515 [Elusimicrobia bacterium CG_4_9_14_3_um_filter_62_55]